MSAPVQDVVTMPAGREMDAAVAERVMGWVRKLGTYGGTTTWQPEGVALLPGDAPHIAAAVTTRDSVTYFGNLAPYSTDIAAAWEVVERINRNRELVDWTRWTGAFGYDLGRLEMMSAANVAEYVCRAALLSMAGER